MDLKAVGQRIKSAREAKNLTQEELAALVNLSPTHVSVIERGLKVTKLDTFVAIANALDVSADTLLIDVVAHSITGVTNEMTDNQVCHLFVRRQILIFHPYAHKHPFYPMATIL